MKKYYVEHLVFSLFYYSFDLFCKSFFALMFLLTEVLSSQLVAELLLPIALVYVIFGCGGCIRSYEVNHELMFLT